MLVLAALMIFVSMMPWCAAAQAQWIHQTEDDPFQGGNVQLAAAIDLSGMVAAFRCTSMEDLSLVFVTPEKMGSLDPNLIAQVPVRILVIVDDADRVSLKAHAEPTPDGEKIRYVATGPQVAPLARAAQKAKRRFAVASELLGELGHSKSFGVRGSTRAIGELADACGLP